VLWQVITQSKEYQGQKIQDLPSDHATAKKWESWRRHDTNHATVNILGLETEHEAVKEHEAFDFRVEHGGAAEVIQRTFQCFQFRKALTSGLLGSLPSQ